MKLLRYGPKGKEKPGLLDDEGKIRDLSRVVDDITPEVISKAGLRELKKVNVKKLKVVPGKPRLGVPLAPIPKIVCVGLNYTLHAKESGVAIPTEPVLFMKAITSITGPNDDVILPRDVKKGDWEVELGIVIGTKAQYVEEKDALKYVAGYTVVNDVSERHFQLERGGSWSKGKGCDTFAPIGPWLVTSDECKDPQNLDMWLELNGKIMQKSNTADMIFRIPKIISYISSMMTLMPGDVIPTGTPSGVGMGQKPEPIWLKPGDVMRLGLTGLGVQQQKVKAYKK
jgi:2-keto-4-pentenoate hydratase/2-oxohepta-3-ene-1,7-dioic acid hydratase in catechol pathway